MLCPTQRTHAVGLWVRNKTAYHVNIGGLRLGQLHYPHDGRTHVQAVHARATPRHQRLRQPHTLPRKHLCPDRRRHPKR